MRATPFLDGFRQAVHPDFVPPALTGPQGQKPRLVPMLSAAELRKLASCYQCSVKTLRRLLNRNVDITDASAIACHLANQKSISVEMAEAVLSHLTESNDQS
jgi:hypothetical protein